MKRATPFDHLRLSGCLFVLLWTSMACTNAPEEAIGQVSSHLKGQITLSAEVDSIPDYSGFQVLVADLSAGTIDTLGLGETNEEGFFELDVEAPKRDIYRLVIGRQGSVLRENDIVVAQGDTAEFNIQFPFGNRPLMLRSRENAALLGFKNTIAIHNQAINTMSNEGIEDRGPYGDRIGQTTEILWSLRDSNPGTLGAELAAAQSIVMLDTWNDSLLVERARTLDPAGMNYSLVVETARRAHTRNEGTEAAVALMEELADKAADPASRATVISELVLAYRDNDQADRALEEARNLRENPPDSTWIQWADRAIFDLENLMPGMEAPDFSLTDWSGNPITKASFAGKVTIIEFYAPGETFDRQLTARNAFYQSSEDAPFELLSISVQPDTLLNEAFFDGREMPGTIVTLPEGPEAQILKDYNVLLLPTRFVIDGEGLIVGKYVLENGARAFQEALTMFLQENAD